MNDTTGGPTCPHGRGPGEDCLECFTADDDDARAEQMANHPAGTGGFQVPPLTFAIAPTPSDPTADPAARANALSAAMHWHINNPGGTGTDRDVIDTAYLFLAFCYGGTAGTPEGLDG